MAERTAIWPFPDPPPPPAPPTYAPATPPPANATPEQQAQYVADRWLAWQAAGSKMGTENGKDYPFGPDGQIDKGIPTTAEFNAARAFLASKASGSAVISAPPTQQFIIHADGTSEPNKNFVKPKPDAPVKVTPGEGIIGPDGTVTVPLPAKPAPRPNVAPGEGTWDPNANGGQGGYAVPVPAKPAAPTKSQAQIDQEAKDAHDKAARDAANSRTPEQTAALDLANAKALEAQRAHDAIDKARTDIQAGIDAGTILPKDAQAQLDEKYHEISAIFDSGVKTAETLYAHNLNQPNVDRTNQLAQQNADSADQARKDQAAQADRNQQSDVYKTQSAQASSFVDQLTKAGIHAEPGDIAAVQDPIWLALHLQHQEVAKGTVPASAISTPSAPVPAAAAAGPPSAPMPAPGVQLPDSVQPGAIY